MCIRYRCSRSKSSSLFINGGLMQKCLGWKLNISVRVDYLNPSGINSSARKCRQFRQCVFNYIHCIIFEYLFVFSINS